jgi:hypothetical protein
MVKMLFLEKILYKISLYTETVNSGTKIPTGFVSDRIHATIKLNSRTTGSTSIFSGGM